MRRKEVIVADKVFNLGLKGLEEATESCRRVGQEMEIDVAGMVGNAGCEETFQISCEAKLSGGFGERDEGVV